MADIEALCIELSSEIDRHRKASEKLEKLTEQMSKTFVCVMCRKDFPIESLTVAPWGDSPK